VSPEFNSEDEVSPTPSTEEEEDYVPPTPSSEEEAPWTPPRPVKRRLFVSETPIHQQGSESPKRGRFGEVEEDSEDEEEEIHPQQLLLEQYFPRVLAHHIFKLDDAPWNTKGRPSQ
jgi:hypothetical protein